MDYLNLDEIGRIAPSVLTQTTVRTLISHLQTYSYYGSYRYFRGEWMESYTGNAIRHKIQVVKLESLTKNIL